MHVQTKDLTDLDMASLRSGWTWTDEAMAKRMAEFKLPSLQCRICRQIAQKLRSAADWFESRAVRMETA